MYIYFGKTVFQLFISVLLINKLLLGSQEGLERKMNYYQKKEISRDDRHELINQHLISLTFWAVVT